jgi:hypothetical protein
MSESRTSLTLEEVSRRLDQAGITWAVFAGAAAAVYGATRPLTDVDILVPVAEGDRAAALFPGERVKRQEDGAVRSIKMPGYDIVAGLTMDYDGETFTVDLDVQMAARLTRHEIAGVPVPIIPPEDNILLKTIWERGPEAGKHDWEDVQAMMAHLPGLDWEYLRWRASTCGSGPRVQQAMKRLEVRG